ncbi:hypothetical protein VP01_3681g2 [Puccinia sorghi]|uniref:Uncharacterized protein n=1 Tax=Puccinia sorghi TaxID=27349 RepID=A0A0L6UV33_9BASI|nr:hypothetical protein VP01_3681g2 [Puccinia sorghi]
MTYFTFYSLFSRGGLPCQLGAFMPHHLLVSSPHNALFNPSLPPHPKVPSDTHTPSHTRSGLISGATLNTPASEVFK